jgi:transposase-like protein
MKTANGISKLRDPDLQRAQALAMAQDRIAGLSIAEVARKYNVHPHTVENRFKLLRREELLEKAVERVVERLLESSMEAYEDLITQTDDKKVRLEAARDIAFGTGVLSKQNNALVNPNPQKGAEMTLRAWREKRFAKQAPGGEGELSETHTVELTQRLPAAVGEGNFTDFGEDEMEGFAEPPIDAEIEEGI